MRKSRFLIIILVFAVITLVSGYITFTATVDVPNKMASTENLQIIFDEIGTIYQFNSYNSTAVIKNNKHMIEVNVPELSGVGAYTIIPVTIKNVGNVPAKLESIYQYSRNTYKNYKISYDGIGVTDAPINPGEVKGFNIKVELINNDIEVPSCNFEIKFNFVQA